MTWKAFLEKTPWDGRSVLRVGRFGLNGAEIAQPLVLKHYEPGILIPDNEIFLRGSLFGEGDPIGFLQAIADLAWENGIKPAQLENHTNELAAVRYHLEDMRKLAKVPK